MKKTLIYALTIMGLAIIVLIFNRGNVEINLLFTELKIIKSAAFFAFISIGVVIGLLLK